MLENREREMRFIGFITFLHKSSLIHTELTGLMLSWAHKRKKKTTAGFHRLWNETEIPLLHLSTAKSQSWAHFCYSLFVARSQSNEGEKTTTTAQPVGRKTLVLVQRPKWKLDSNICLFLLRHFMSWRWKHQNSKKILSFHRFSMHALFSLLLLARLYRIYRI